VHNLLTCLNTGTGCVGKINLVPVASVASKSFHPNEPERPSVKTAIPGPKSLERLAQLSRLQVKQEAQLWLTNCPTLVHADVLPSGE